MKRRRASKHLGMDRILGVSALTHLRCSQAEFCSPTSHFLVPCSVAGRRVASEECLLTDGMTASTSTKYCMHDSFLHPTWNLFSWHADLAYVLYLSNSSSSWTCDFAEVTIYLLPLRICRLPLSLVCSLRLGTLGKTSEMPPVAG